MRTRIKELRARHNLTQAQLADLLGVRRETISFIEQGKYNPSLRLAHRIARALKSTLDELYIFDEEDEKAEKGVDAKESDLDRPENLP
jgi:putative transcriptional regulator